MGTWQTVCECSVNICVCQVREPYVANVEDAESSNAVHVRLRELDDTYGGANRDRTGNLLHAMKHIAHCKLLITMRANQFLTCKSVQIESNGYMLILARR